MTIQLTVRGEKRVEAPVESAAMASSDFPRLLELLLASVLYTVVIAATTLPLVTQFNRVLPLSGPDGLQHLWVMNWYQDCLENERLPWNCERIQYPTTTPFGRFTPLHIQSLAYILLSQVFSNDTLIYNLIWLIAQVTTGLGVYSLSWYLSRSQLSALFAGLVTVVSTPIRNHSYGHLELITLGAVPFFLVCWIRYIRIPSWSRLASALGTYALVSMSAAYFALFSIFPATLYVVLFVRNLIKERLWGELRKLVGSVSLFSFFSFLILLLLFSSQVWALVHGLELSRSRFEYDTYRAPLWSYFVPMPDQLLGGFYPFDFYEASGHGTHAVELCSYLGLVTIVLLHTARKNRSRALSEQYCWLSLVAMVVLSLGPFIDIGEFRISLPAEWLWDVFPPIRMTRVPARFNLFAVVFASVLAGVGMKHTLASRRGVRRSILFTIISLVAVADLTRRPFYTETLRPIPAGYAQLLEDDPDASFLEIPHFDSGANRIMATSAYWQSIHGGFTSGGYAGHLNQPYNQEIYAASPFRIDLMQQPSYLSDPNNASFELVRSTTFDGYMWLYLSAHDFDYVAIHRWPGATDGIPVHLEPLLNRYRDSIIVENEELVVLDRRQLPSPDQAVMLPTKGWSHRWKLNGQTYCKVSPAAEIVVYNPDPEQILAIAFEVASIGSNHQVRLMFEDYVLGEWTIGRRESDLLVFSDHFQLPSGVSTLRLVSEAIEPNVDQDDRRKDKYGFHVAATCLQLISDDRSMVGESRMTEVEQPVSTLR